MLTLLQLSQTFRFSFFEIFISEQNFKIVWLFLLIKVQDQLWEFFVHQLTSTLHDLSIETIPGEYCWGDFYHFEWTRTTWAWGIREKRCQYQCCQYTHKISHKKSRDPNSRNHLSNCAPVSALGASPFVSFFKQIRILSLVRYPHQAPHASWAN